MSYILSTCPVVYLSVGYSSYVSHSIYMCHILSNYVSYSLPMCHVQSSHLYFGLYVFYSLATCHIIYLDVLHSIDVSCSLSKCHVQFSHLSYDLRVSYSFYMSYSLSTCLIGDKYTKFDYPWSCQLNTFFESCQQIAGTALAIYLDFCNWSIVARRHRPILEYTFISNWPMFIIIHCYSCVTSPMQISCKND